MLYSLWQSKWSWTVLIVRCMFTNHFSFLFGDLSIFKISSNQYAPASCQALRCHPVLKCYSGAGQDSSIGRPWTHLFPRTSNLQHIRNNSFLKGPENYLNSSFTINSKRANIKTGKSRDMLSPKTPPLVQQLTIWSFFLRRNLYPTSGIPTLGPAMERWTLKMFCVENQWGSHLGVSKGYRELRYFS